jgi:purine-binding chemotaxis protein CheW
MQEPDFLFVFALDDQRYALPLHAADKVVRVAAIRSLPKAPDIVLGVVNLHGRIIPVIDMRKRFALPERETMLTGQLLVAHTARRQVALIVDAVLDVMPCPARSLVAANSIVPGIGYVEGVVKLEDGLVVIHDLDKFLSLEEDEILDHALKAG